MKLPEYISVAEVQRVCEELKLQDWTLRSNPQVSAADAASILAEVNVEGMAIDVEAFRQGLEVELEHGLQFKDANVTNNHPVLTGKIVLAHFKESMEYYYRLEVAELEGDLFKAASAGKAEKVKGYYKRLAAARIRLAEVELNSLEDK
jgi:hypothetical protein